MGLLSSRQAPSENAEDVTPAHSYKYPPKSGLYFGTHFMMGGERFESAQPEAYLFGDNTDLNFLGPKPVPFPYHQPSSTEPVRTLQCLVAIRRDSLKFARTSSDQKRPQFKLNDEKMKSSSDSDSDLPATAAQSHSTHVDLTRFEETQYNIEFVFDCDTPCSITIYYFATEETGPDGLRYISNRPDLTSPTYHYEIGAAQVFSHPEHVFDPCLYRADELQHNCDTEIVPLVIHCVAESPDNGCGPQSHSTLAVIEKSAEGHGFVLKPLKQKIYVDGVCYLLQEIYGIENKNLITANNASGVPGSPTADSAGRGQEATSELANEESGTECVVCMSELRDTLILPCRHLCICSGCAETLRYKASCCPICRAPFRALLQVKTLRRIRHGPVVGGHNVEQAVTDSIVSTAAPAFLNRYETVALIEALNGPMEAPTVMLPINPIPATTGPATSTATVTGHTNKAHATNSGSAGAPKRPKTRKTRQSVVIQEVLTPQALVHPLAEQHSVENEKSTTSGVDDDDDRATASSKVSLKSNPPPAQAPQPLLPGQMNEDEQANSDEEYVEAHSVACGEVVAKPELEGPTTDDETEITFESCGSTGREGGVTKLVNTKPIKSDNPSAESARTANVFVEKILGGMDTPNSNNSVTSVASATSAQPLLPDQQHGCTGLEP